MHEETIKPNPIDRVISTLRWNNESYVDEVNIKWFDDSLSALVCKISQLQNPDRDSLKQAIANLPRDGVSRLLKSPTLLSLLADDGNNKNALGFVEFLSQSILAEYFISDDSVNPQSIGIEGLPLWSAIGDIKINNDVNRSSIELGHSVSDYKGIIPLDFNSPYIAYRNREELNNQKMIPYSIDLQYEISRKISEALSILNTNALVTDFIAKNCSVICNIPNDVNPLFFTSVSERTLVGKIVLENVHLGSVSVATLVNAIVHESIHSFLYKFELSNRFIISLKLTQEKIRSAWSGNKIKVATYPHACLIYFALFNLWSTTFMNNMFDKKQAIEQKNFIQRGFEKNLAMLSDENSSMSNLRPDVIASIFQISKEVVNTDIHL